MTRISLTTLQGSSVSDPSSGGIAAKGGMGFFGLYGSTAALATTLTLAAVVNCIGIGFLRGTHANWQLVANDGTGAPTLTDLGAAFAIATGGVVTLFIAAPPNGSSVWVRAVNEVTGAVFEQEITSDLPAATQFLSPRLNTLENFSFVFNKMLEGLFIERMEGNEEIFTRLMNDDSFRGIATEHLVREVYEKIRKGIERGEDPAARANSPQRARDVG